MEPFKAVGAVSEAHGYVAQRAYELTHVIARRMYGPQLNVLGIIDPALDRAQTRISDKTSAGVAGYSNAQVWATAAQAGQALTQSTAVDLVVVGAPPHFRGCTTPNANLDLQLLAALPHAKRWLVEKPASAAPPSEANGQKKVAEAYAQSGATVASGYMMCSLKGVEMIQRIIKEKGLTVMGTAARWVCALARPSDVTCVRTADAGATTGTIWRTNMLQSRRGGTSKSRADVSF